MVLPWFPHRDLSRSWPVRSRRARRFHCGTASASSRGGRSCARPTHVMYRRGDGPRSTEVQKTSAPERARQQEHAASVMKKIIGFFSDDRPCPRALPSIGPFVPIGGAEDAGSARNPPPSGDRGRPRSGVLALQRRPHGRPLPLIHRPGRPRAGQVCRRPPD